MKWSSSLDEMVRRSALQAQTCLAVGGTQLQVVCWSVCAPIFVSRGENSNSFRIGGAALEHLLIQKLELSWGELRSCSFVRGTLNGLEGRLLGALDENHRRSLEGQKEGRKACAMNARGKWRSSYCCLWRLPWEAPMALKAKATLLNVGHRIYRR